MPSGSLGRVRAPVGGLDAAVMRPGRQVTARVSQAVEVIGRMHAQFRPGGCPHCPCRPAGLDRSGGALSPQ
jgi:hypothetical protein